LRNLKDDSKFRSANILTAVETIFHYTYTAIIPALIVRSIIVDRKFEFRIQRPFLWFVTVLIFNLLGMFFQERGESENP
jgi:ABC-type nickel/cobalt efflux system permease component RcnA